MSMKAMVFIDGAWLYRNRSSIFMKLGEANGCEIDYAKLPRVFCEDVANFLDEDISLVRTNYFGTLPSARSSFSSSKQRSFYDFLERSCGYEMEIHEVDVGGEGGHDDMWIKMALGASLMFSNGELVYDDYTMGFVRAAIDREFDLPWELESSDTGAKPNAFPEK